METNYAKDIIVKIIQTALTNKVKPDEFVNPQAIAEAIASKVEFEKSVSTVKADKIIQTLEDGIEIFYKDCEEELSLLHEDEKLLANFAHGKITAYQEILNLLKSI